MCAFVCNARVSSARGVCNESDFINVVHVGRYVYKLPIVVYMGYSYERCVGLHMSQASQLLLVIS